MLTDPANDKVVYELGGTSFTFAELAATISAVTGVEVAYHDLSVAEYAAVLESVGLPSDTAAFVASLDEGVANGELEVSTDDLVSLIGRRAPRSPRRSQRPRGDAEVCPLRWWADPHHRPGGPR